MREEKVFNLKALYRFYIEYPFTVFSQVPGFLHALHGVFMCGAQHRTTAAARAPPPAAGARRRNPPESVGRHPI